MKSEKRSAGSLGLWTGLSDILLLFLALASTVFGVVTAYRIEVIPAALWAGIAVFAVLSHQLVNPRKYSFLLLAVMALLWFWGVWRLWEALVWGGTRIQCDVVNTIAAKIPGVPAISPVMELPQETWTALTTLWLLTIGALYALVLGLALCRLRKTSLTILWMLLPILPAVCVTEAPDSLPMAGMLAVWLTLILTSLTGSRDPAGTARLRPIAFMWATVALVCLNSSLPNQGTAQPLWAADIRDAALSDMSRLDVSALLSRWSGWTGAGSTEYMNLLRAAPTQSDRVALWVECDTVGKYYLRGYSADVYTGRRWEPLDKRGQKELEAVKEEGMEPLLMMGEKAAVLRSYLYEGYSGRQERQKRMKVENVAAPGGCVYYPYALAQLPENAAFGGDSHLERTGAVWEHEFTFYNNWRAMEGYWGFDVSEEEKAYRQFVYSHELQVPEELRPILEKWLREGMAGSLDMSESLSQVMGEVTLENYVRYCLAYDAWFQQWGESEYFMGQGEMGPTREDMEAVSLTEEQLEQYRRWYTVIVLGLVTNWLEETTHYDRNTPAPPAGEDYVDWFLNKSRQGYCMHYATAATLLLRTAGIPARYVSGYLAEVSRPGRVEVTERAAHAWVEVYYDGVGWYPLEVTPGYQGGGMGDTLEIPTEVSAEPSSAAATSTPSAAPAPSQEPEETPPPAVVPSPSQAPEEPDGPEEELMEADLAGGGYVLILLILLSGFILGRQYGLKRRREKLEGTDANKAVLYAYRCHSGLRPWGGQERRELTMLAEKAKFSQHTLTSAEQDRAKDIFVRERDRIGEELPVWKRPLFRFWWGK